MDLNHARLPIPPPGQVKRGGETLRPSALWVNGISPGYVPTEVMMTALDTDKEQLEQMAAKRIPLKRLGTPDDMGSTAVYLASDAGSWMTGQTLIVAGGL